MRRITTEVLVIGGGATGAGVLRDLALRGFKAVLVEKSDLTTGTTGRYHGLLHSGGRYAVRDPLAARECMEENRILRRIMPHCIEDTGGFFVVTPWDDPDYIPKFLDGCHMAGIPVDEVPVRQMLREEPRLNPRISHCYRVPDGSADSFLGTEVNVDAARQSGAAILNYHPVTRLLLDRPVDGKAGGSARSAGARVIGALCHDLVKDEEVEISADLVVNAAGAWCGKIAATAGIPLTILPGKGTMVAVNHRVVNTVINRCRLPADADILVPAHTVAVMGTTDIKVEDPDHFGIEPWEVQLMREEGEKLVPGFKNLRLVRSWAGVRPLYKDTVVTANSNSAPEASGAAAGENRAVTRAFVLLDHEARDGVSGMITITSGKWTTYRKMAEVAVDLACSKLGVQRACRTHLEALPGAGKHGHHALGTRLAQIEKEESYGQLVCECELATYADVERAISIFDAQTLDDVRRDARLGMGPCQAGFCTFRAAGILHKLRRLPVEETNVALRDFLQERWKGLLPILWGQQLRQERLNELIYLSLLNADHLPGPEASPLRPVMYTSPSGKAQPLRVGVEMGQAEPVAVAAEAAAIPGSYVGSQVDVLVVGAGLAGLVAAWQSARRGKRTRLISKGWGATHWASGAIDVLGYYPSEDHRVDDSLAESLGRLVRDCPWHPYAIAGLPALEESLAAFQELCAQAGYPLHGSLERNWLLPSALGIPRPTCLAPEMMVAGDMRAPGSMLIVGFESFGDFYPELIAANLEAQGMAASAVTLNLSQLEVRRFNTARSLAWMFDQPEFRHEVAAAIQKESGGASRIGFPAVLGADHPLEAKRELEASLGAPVFEIPLLPPSIPGIRLSRLLVAAIERAGGRVFDGMQATGAQAGEAGAGRVEAVLSEAAARAKPHRAEQFILATGGILGGGIHAEADGQVHETILDLPLQEPGKDRSAWFQREFLCTTGHPIFRSGVRVNARFQPVGEDGQPPYANLFAVGGALAGCDMIQERSLEGVALVSGYRVGSQV